MALNITIKIDKKLQYIVEWNWGEINPLENVSYQQVFSNGQIFLPDTIKVFRVYKGQLTDKDGNRKLDLSENGIMESMIVQLDFTLMKIQHLKLI